MRKGNFVSFKLLRHHVTGNLLRVDEGLLASLIQSNPYEM